MKLWATLSATFVLSVVFGHVGVLAQYAVVPPDVVPDAFEPTAHMGTSFTIAFIASWLLEIWKKHPRLGVMTEYASRLVQRAIALVVAAGTSLGIGFTFDQGAGSLLITGLTIASISSSIWAAIQQFIYQEFLYLTAFKQKG